MSSAVASWITSARPYLRADRLRAEALQYWDMNAGYHRLPTGKPDCPSSADFHHAVGGDAGPVHRKSDIGRIQTGAVVERERLLFDRRGNGGPAAAIADDAPRHHRCTGERVDVADGVHSAVVQAEERGLRAIGQQYADSATRDEAVVGARPRPYSNVVDQDHVSAPFRTVGMGIGTMRPCRSVNVTVGSGASGALPNETNRDSLSGSSSTPFHSQAYPATWRAIASSKSAASPRESLQTTSRR